MTELKRRRFLKAALGTVVGVCLPLPAISHAQPPSLRSVPTAGETLWSEAVAEIMREQIEVIRANQMCFEEPRWIRES